MAVKIRLARAGAKKTPFYRVVVADARAPRDGRFIEILGRYNPRTDPSTIQIDVDRVDAWLAKGAQPTEAVEKLIAIARNPEREAPVRETKPSKKSAARAAAAETKPAEAPETKTGEVVEAVEAEEASAEAPVAEEPVAEVVEAEEPAENEEAAPAATDVDESTDDTPADEASQ